MKTIYRWINNHPALEMTWKKSLSVLLPSALLAGTPLVAADTGNGISAPSGTYSSPAGIVAPSGTYATPVPAFAPSTSPGDASFQHSGHIPIVFSASVSEVYDDNIFVQPVKVDDFITQINLLADYKIGNDKAIDAGTFDIFYAPSFDIYANHSAQDSFNNNVGAQFQYRFSKLTLGIQQTYNRESQTSAAVGNLVTTSNFNTHASADYFYSDKLSIVTTFTQNVLNYNTSGYSSSNEWVGDTYFLYKIDSKLSLGFGPRFGWLDVTLAPNQTYQDVLGRAEYLYSKKLAFNLSAGVEIREYEGPNPSTTVAPVFSLAATYTPFENTTVTLIGSRLFNPSYNFNGQDYIATKVQLTGRQRFLDKFDFNLGLGFENDAYQAAGVALTGPARNDDYYFVTTGFDWNPNNWLTAAIFYKYQTDDSNFSGFSFNDNQVGASVGFTY